MKRTIPPYSFAFYIIALTLLVVCWGFIDATAQRRSSKSRSTTNNNSGELTRSKAAELIRARMNSAAKVKIFIGLDLVTISPDEWQEIQAPGYGSDLNQTTFVIGSMNKGFGYGPEHTAQIGVLAKLGYVYCEVIPESTYGVYRQTIPAQCKVRLTEKGVKASADWEVSTTETPLDNLTALNIPVARAELIEVTGIATIEALNHATADFTWRITPIGDIGRALAPLHFRQTSETQHAIGGQTRFGKAQFQKYDDGWRILSY